jgi:Putative beta-barrel porin-2, OmpL-like. bbp2
MNRHGKQLIAAAMMLGTAMSGAALADDAAAAKPPAGPGITDVLTASGITESGYIAASYYNSNGFPSNIHQFDTAHDSFQLDQAGLMLSYQPMTGFGGVIDIIAGEDAKVLHVAEDGNSTSIDVKQAFVQYATGPVTIMAGKFVTLAGAEVIAPTGNTNFSRGLLFFNQPLTHTGVRVTYAASGTVNLIFGVNNGWNSTSTQGLGSKTGELGIGWTPNKIFALTAQAYFGKTTAFNGVDGGLEIAPTPHTLVDVVATYNVTPSLTLILNYDWSKQDGGIAIRDTEDTIIGSSDAKWSGLAAYVNYAINDQWRLSLRGEYVDDKDGYLTGTDQKVKDVTLTFGYSPVKSFELRFEGRLDKADDNIFYRSRAAYNEGTPDGDSLSEFAVQGVFKF